MIPLLFVALADTDVVGINPDLVYVHEWGVVEVDQTIPTAVGADWGYLGDDGVLEPYHPMEVEAPVVWFHGAECVGTFTVSANDGYFTALTPPPDSMIAEGQDDRISFSWDPPCDVCVWNNVILSAESYEEEEEVEQIPTYDMGDFSWAAPIWRRVPANYVIVPGSMRQDRFIYYECTTGSIAPFTSDYPPSNRTYGYTGEALVFSDEGGELSARLADVDGSVSVTGDELMCDEILEVFCRWGGNRFKSLEIQALWETWEPAVAYRCFSLGQDVMMFPLSQSQVESISTLHFQSNWGNPVEYVRMFLGLGAVEYSD